MGAMLKEPVHITGFPRSGNTRMRQSALYMYLDGKVSYLGFENIHGAIGKANKMSYNHGFNNKKTVYVMRHPFDVVVSYHKFFHMPIEKAIDSLLSGTELWLSWVDHIDRAKNHPNDILFCKFEKYGEDQLRQVADFIGFEYIDGILEDLAFDKIYKEQQRQHAYRDKGGVLCCQMACNFLWTGESNKDWKSYMDDKQIKRVLNECKPTMDILGYSYD